MPRISKTQDNLFDIPHGAVIAKNNYVYVNTSTKTFVSKKPGKGKISTHDKKCVGIALVESKSRPTKMYANAAYMKLYAQNKLPKPPVKADSLSIGSYLAVQATSEQENIGQALCKSFGLDATHLILDLATYMLDEESAIFQHFPRWARRHCQFSGSICDDTTIGNFLREELTKSKIEDFKKTWAREHIGNGHVYVCYDSTNVNSQAKGVFLVQKGHAKDNPDLDQINTDYVVRQEDGLPITFKEFPGSIVDMSEATDMIHFLSSFTNKALKIVMVCDRGYISEDNVQDFDAHGIGFLLMLKDNLRDSKELIRTYAGELRNRSEHYMPEFDAFGMTVRKSLFKNGPERYFHIIWDPTLEAKSRKSFLNRLQEMEKQLESAKNRKQLFVEEELKFKFPWFKIQAQEKDSIQHKGRGRGEKKLKAGFEIVSYARDTEQIDKELNGCGCYVLVSSEEMTCEKASYEYKKRDSVEKVFRALKSSLGMDVIGTHSDDAIIGKSLIWFVASILRSVIHKRLEKLRGENRKYFTVPGVMDELDAVVADKDLASGKYERRYQFTAKQNKIFKALGITPEDVADAIAAL